MEWGILVQRAMNARFIIIRGIPAEDPARCAWPDQRGAGACAAPRQPELKAAPSGTTHRFVTNDMRRTAADLNPPADYAQRPRRPAEPAQAKEKPAQGALVLFHRRNRTRP
jgi:hypothetical protein